MRGARSRSRGNRRRETGAGADAQGRHPLQSHIRKKTPQEWVDMASHYPTVPITKPLPYARREFPWRTRVLNNQTIPSYDESLRREAQQLKSSDMGRRGERNRRLHSGSGKGSPAAQNSEINWLFSLRAPAGPRRERCVDVRSCRPQTQTQLDAASAPSAGSTPRSPYQLSREERSFLRSPALTPRGSERIQRQPESSPAEDRPDAALNFLETTISSMDGMSPQQIYEAIIGSPPQVGRFEGAGSKASRQIQESSRLTHYPFGELQLQQGSH